MEYWDLVDLNGRRTGLRHLRGQPLPPELRHIVVSIWVVSNEGRLLPRCAPHKRRAGRVYGRIPAAPFSRANIRSKPPCASCMRRRGFA